MNTPVPILLSKQDIAALLSVRPRTVNRLVARGLLARPLYLSRTCARWPREAVDAMLTRLSGESEGVAK